MMTAREGKATAASALAATKVFETTELMEVILLHIDPEDVLKAMKVSKAMRDTVNGSTAIKTAIGLLPDWNADFTTTLWKKAQDINTYWSERDKKLKFHGFGYFDYNKRYERTYDHRYDDVQWGWIPDPRRLTHAEFRLTTSAGSSTSLMKLGSRLQALSPCQPPVKRMKVYYRCHSCAGAFDDIPDVAGKILPSNGQFITLGDMHRVNVKVRAEHRKMCADPRAKSRVCVEFNGKSRLRQDDPIMLERQDEDIGVNLYMFWRWDSVPPQEGQEAEEEDADEEEDWRKLKVL